MYDSSRTGYHPYPAALCSSRVVSAVLPTEEHGAHICLTGTSRPVAPLARVGTACDAPGVRADQGLWRVADRWQRNRRGVRTVPGL